MGPKRNGNPDQTKVTSKQVFLTRPTARHPPREATWQQPKRPARQTPNIFKIKSKPRQQLQHSNCWSPLNTLPDDNPPQWFVAPTVDNTNFSPNTRYESCPSRESYPCRSVHSHQKITKMVCIYTGMGLHCHYKLSSFD